MLLRLFRAAMTMSVTCFVLGAVTVHNLAFANLTEVLVCNSSSLWLRLMWHSWRRTIAILSMLLPIFVLDTISTTHFAPTSMT